MKTRKNKYVENEERTLEDRIDEIGEEYRDIKDTLFWTDLTLSTLNIWTKIESFFNKFKRKNPSRKGE